MFTGIVPTCSIVDAYLRSIEETDQTACAMAQDYFADYCGCTDEDASAEKIEAFDEPCSPRVHGGKITVSERDLGIEGFPFEKCSLLQDALATILDNNSKQCSMFQNLGQFCGCAPDKNQQIKSTCKLCPDGSSVTSSATPFSFLKNDFGGLVPTCGIVESFMLNFDPASETYTNVQLVNSICGCPATENHCHFCPVEELQEEFADKPLPQLEHYFGASGFTCKEAWSTQDQIHEDSEICTLGKAGSFLCGCDDGRFHYF